jgi:hypothetical protein
MFDVYMIKRDALLVVRPGGIIGARTTEQIVDLIEIREAEFETGFNRFCDLTRLKGIRLSCAEVFKLAERRRAFNPNNIAVKSAFLATDPLAFWLARLYEELLDSPRIEVRVWRDLQSAAIWLGVTPDRLTL